jgi:hypothetical protein
LLTDHQKELEKAMLHREQHGRENRRSAPSAAASPQPSHSALDISGIRPPHKPSSMVRRSRGNALMSCCLSLAG